MLLNVFRRSTAPSLAAAAGLLVGACSEPTAPATVNVTPQPPATDSTGWPVDGERWRPWLSSLAPDAQVDAYRALTKSPRWNPELATAVLNHLATTAPDLPAKAIGTEPDRRFVRRALPDAMLDWAAQEPAAALAWHVAKHQDLTGAQMPPDFYRDTFAVLPPADAVASLLRLPRQGYLVDKLPALDATLQKAALNQQQIAGLPPALRSVALASQADWPQAESLARSLQVPADRRTATGRIAKNWIVASSPTKAETISKATTLLDVAGGDGAALTEVSENLRSAVNLPAVMEWLAALPPSPERDRQVRLTAEWRAHVAPDEAAAWLSKLGLDAQPSSATSE